MLIQDRMDILLPDQEMGVTIPHISNIHLPWADLIDLLLWILIYISHKLPI